MRHQLRDAPLGTDVQALSGNDARAIGRPTPRSSAGSASAATACPGPEGTGGPSRAPAAASSRGMRPSGNRAAGIGAALGLEFDIGTPRSPEPRRHFGCVRLLPNPARRSPAILPNPITGATRGQVSAPAPLRVQLSAPEPPVHRRAWAPRVRWNAPAVGHLQQGRPVTLGPHRHPVRAACARARRLPIRRSRYRASDSARNPPLPYQSDCASASYRAARQEVRFARRRDSHGHARWSATASAPWAR